MEQEQRKILDNAIVDLSAALETARALRSISRAEAAITELEARIDNIIAYLVDATKEGREEPEGSMENDALLQAILSKGWRDT